MAVAFNYIPSTLRLPGFRAEVQAGRSRSVAYPYVGLIAAQMTDAGTKCVKIATSALSASGAVIHFTNAAAIANVLPGMFAIDRTATGAIPSMTTVLSKSNGDITLSAAVTSVGSGDNIAFYDLTPTWMTSQTNASQLWGAGSQVARMYRQWRQVSPFSEVYVMPIPDDPASVAASETLTFTGSVTATGVLWLYVAGVGIAVVLTNAMSATQCASAVSSAVNANTDLPVTSSPSAGVVTFTAKNAGLAGNDIDIRVNYRGIQNGEVTPAGIMVTLSGLSSSSSGSSSLASGATNPSTMLAALLALLPNRNWGALASPYTDATSLNDIQTFMGDVNGQWSWLTMKYGSAFLCQRTTLASLQTNGLARNDQHACIMGVYNSPAPADEWSAAFAAAYLQAQLAQPGCSSNYLALTGLLPPAVVDRFHDVDKDTLLHSGISVFDVEADGSVIIRKAITTYQTNVLGNVDPSFLQVDDMFRIAAAIRYMQAKSDEILPQARLEADGTRLPPGLNIVTPSTYRAYLLGWYDDLIAQGIVQDKDGFSAGLVVEIDAANDKRLDVLWPGKMVGDLDIVALAAQPVT
jgi:phage tail sheath gpL-like